MSMREWEEIQEVLLGKRLRTGHGIGSQPQAETSPTEASSARSFPRRKFSSMGAIGCINNHANSFTYLDVLGKNQRNMPSVTRTDVQIAHEDAVIRAFFLLDKQERFLAFVLIPKSRRELTQELAHFRWFDQRFVNPLAWRSIRS
jgi:hypothetical protein